MPSAPEMKGAQERLRPGCSMTWPKSHPVPGHLGCQQLHCRKESSRGQLRASRALARRFPHSLVRSAPFTIRSCRRGKLRRSTTGWLQLRGRVLLCEGPWGCLSTPETPEARTKGPEPVCESRTWQVQTYYLPSPCCVCRVCVILTTALHRSIKNAQPQNFGNQSFILEPGYLRPSLRKPRTLAATLWGAWRGKGQMEVSGSPTVQEPRASSPAHSPPPLSCPTLLPRSRRTPSCWVYTSGFTQA